MRFSTSLNEDFSVYTLPGDSLDKIRLRRNADEDRGWGACLQRIYPL